MSTSKEEVLEILKKNWKDCANGFNESSQGIEERIKFCMISVEFITAALQETIKLLPDKQDDHT